MFVCHTFRPLRNLTAQPRIIIHGLGPPPHPSHSNSTMHRLMRSLSIYVGTRGTYIGTQANTYQYRAFMNSPGKFKESHDIFRGQLTGASLLILNTHLLCFHI